MTTRKRTPLGEVQRTASRDKAEALVREAMERRCPVTLLFREVRKDDDTGKPVKFRHPDTGRMVNAYVEVLRTIEFFDVDTSEKGDVYFTGMDRVPRDRSVPGVVYDRPSIRRVRADRVSEMTLHRGPYHIQNTYFIDKVRAHARLYSGPGKWAREVGRLSDDALWEVIQYASSREEAERIAEDALNRM